MNLKRHLRLAHRKTAWVVIVVALTTAVSGYFMGLRQTASTISLRRDTAPQMLLSDAEAAPPKAAGIPQAVSYSELAEAGLKANSGWENRLDKLAMSVPLLDTNAPTAQEWLAALERRSRRRAFEGAPPTVPHPIDQLTSDNCLSCHEEGKRIKGRTAPAVSHPHYASCTQCHVPETALAFASQSSIRFPAVSSNSFVSSFTVERGQRAYPEAPPTIPHTTWMRQDCRACHGPYGDPGLRTSHWDRQNCTQCHVRSAAADQLDLLARYLAPSAKSTGAEARHE